MDLHLSGKVAVVTGASKGIGLATAKAFAEEGALVVAGARRMSKVAPVAGITAVDVDLAEPSGPATLIDQAISRHGRIDVLVNNVGAVKLRLGGFLETSDDEFEWAMKMNFFTALRASRAAVTRMIEQGSGSIVNVTSVNAFFQPDAGTIDYGAAKAALLNLNKTLAQQFGPRGIRVNAVSPGPVTTDLWFGQSGVADTVSKATGLSPEAACDHVVTSIGGFATRRFTTPEEVAALILMLASDRAANVTGSNFVIDGGLLKTL